MRISQLVYFVTFTVVLSVYYTSSIIASLPRWINKLQSEDNDYLLALNSSELALYIQKREVESRAAFRSNASEQSSSSSKILWMFWEQGMDNLESQASRANNKYKNDFACVQAWKILNPTWDVRVLNQAKAMELAPRYAVLASDTTGRHTNVKRSNILRLELLSMYGGVWADTSICPFRPLDDFMPLLLQNGGFFARYLGGPDKAGDKSGPELQQYAECHKFHLFGDWFSSKARSAATWFLAVDKPHNMFIDAWLDALFEHMVDVLRLESCWSSECFYPYFIAHCTFTQVRMNNKTIDDAWSTYRTTKASGKGVCFGKATKFHGEYEVDEAKRECYLVKKQSGRLADYVGSGMYLNYIKQLVASDPGNE